MRFVYNIKKKYINSFGKTEFECIYKFYDLFLMNICKKIRMTNLETI